jgi:hypothetical protein
MNKAPGFIARLTLMVQACIFAAFAFPTAAFAYVDPGSGSVIVTTILGLIAAIGYTFRKYFYKLKRLITGRKDKDEDDGRE